MITPKVSGTAVASFHAGYVALGISRNEAKSAVTSGHSYRAFTWTGWTDNMVLTLVYYWR